jgi:hypothetical protein
MTTALARSTENIALHIARSRGRWAFFSPVVPALLERTSPRAECLSDGFLSPLLTRKVSISQY